MTGQLSSLGIRQPSGVIELVEILRAHLEFTEPGPPRLHGHLGAVLLGVEADGRRLDPHGQVLAHDRDEEAFVGEILGNGQNPRVVVTQPKATGKGHRVGVIELDPQAAAIDADRHRGIEAAMGDPQVVQLSQGRAGEVAQLRVVTLALEFADDDDGQDHLVLLEAEHRFGIREEDGGVDDIGPTRFTARCDPGGGAGSSGPAARGGSGTGGCGHC